MSLSERVAPQLPYLRRYARALSGSQEAGDSVVAATLEALLAAPEVLEQGGGTRIALYRLFHVVWTGTQDPAGGSRDAAGKHEQAARRRLEALALPSRQALLLTALEGLSSSEAAAVMDLQEEEIDRLVGEAISEIDSQTATSILIIEDEPIISMDLEGIVTGMGHEVSAVARTRGEAVKAAGQARPGLVLADIQLADGSSGIDAVKDILGSFSVPVIFITAYPERLLTGERPEPTFLITKPFQERTVKAAISQALFFGSTAQFG